MLETNTNIYPRFMNHGDGNPNRKRKGKPFGGIPLMSPAVFKQECIRLMEEAKGRDKPLLYYPTGDPNDVRISMGDPAIKTVPWTNFQFPVLTEDTIAHLESLNHPSRKPPIAEECPPQPPSSPKESSFYFEEAKPAHSPSLYLLSHEERIQIMKARFAEGEAKAKAEAILAKSPPRIWNGMSSQQRQEAEAELAATAAAYKPRIRNGMTSQQGEEAAAAGIQARVKGGVSVLESPLEHLNLTTVRTPQTTTTVRPPTFSVHQNNRPYHRPYTPTNTKRPFTFNSYDPLPVNFNQNQVNIFNNLKHVPNNLKQVTHVGNNLKQETRVENIPVRVTGSDVPDPVNLFTDIDLGNVLNKNIRVRCKYVKPTPIQRHAIPVVMGGRDLMACAQTGSGKIAVFCFPIISGVMKMGLGNGCGYGGVASPLALVLSPTRELCCQIFEEAKKFCHQTGVKVAVAYGGPPVFNQLRSFERGVDILVATPGRLADMVERSVISLKKIKYLALDEADRMLDIGFEPHIRKIVEHMDMPPPGRRQTMLFSATFRSDIQRLASDFLSNYIFLSVGKVGSSTDLIQQKIVYVEEKDKKDHLRNLLQEQKANGNLGKNSLTVIFVETKRNANMLENWLCRSGFPATAIHGDKVQFERERALQLFKSGVTPILVATDVSSRGLDIPSVAHVINFDLPRDIDSYVYRIGRTGRAGKSGIATAFFNDKNSCVAKSISELMKEAKQETPDWLAQYAESYATADHRHGSSKFGGRDFRSGNNSSNESSDYYSATNSYGNSDYGASSGGESMVAGGWE